MEERVYKAMGRAGTLSIVLGVVSIVVGMTKIGRASCRERV